LRAGIEPETPQILMKTLGFIIITAGLGIGYLAHVWHSPQINALGAVTFGVGVVVLMYGYILRR
jgi:uncharacterized membrane protein